MIRITYAADGRRALGGGHPTVSGCCWPRTEDVTSFVVPFSAERHKSAMLCKLSPVFHMFSCFKINFNAGSPLSFPMAA